MFDGPDNDSTVSPLVRDVVVFALWIPPILILIAIGVAAIGLAWQIVQGKSVPVDVLTDAVPPSILVTGAVVAVGYLYLMLANETFGTETVEDTLDQAQETADKVQNDN
jgi:hypothetical protein